MVIQSTLHLSSEPLACIDADLAVPCSTSH